MILLTGHDLTIEEIERVARFNEPVGVHQDAYTQVKKSRQFVEKIVSFG